MRNPRVLSTTPAASFHAMLFIAASAIATAYYRLSLPFFLLCLYLLYLLWSYYWTWASCRSVDVEFPSLQDSIFAGETYSRNFKFSNDWFLPLVRCGVSFYLPPQFSCSGDVLMSHTPVPENEEIAVTPEYIYPSWHLFTAPYAWVGEQKNAVVKIDTTAPYRGIYWLPAPHFYAGDPSGLFNGTVEVGMEQLLYVFPQLKNTEYLLKAVSYEENGRKDIYGIEDRYQFQGVRDYQPSDPVKSINWYATARTGSLKTNIYERKESDYCLVALDVTMSGQSLYTGNSVRVEDPLLEEAISLAAGIALYHLEQGARTAFLTNAPTLQWERGKSSEPGARSLVMKRLRQITALDFAAGSEHTQKLLKLCAALDENGRAYPIDQKKLWLKIMEAPAHTLLYLVCCHTPPPGWQKTAEYVVEEETSDPSSFYSSLRLSRLASSRVKVINLSGGSKK